MYLGIEHVLAISAALVRTIFGFEIEPQFNEPYLSTSLQDFWGRRWNLMVTSILCPTVYDLVCGTCCHPGHFPCVRVVVKKAMIRSGWRLHRAVSGPLTLAFVAVTGNWLFFPQLVRNGVDRKAIREYAILVDFLRSKLPVHLVKSL
ncbi:hypothetical protein PIB30_100771 [Stylosanthes scabra]|uniref:Wax synthase domain-containing protein n=1 Tax=Stylosanthes scabra TaxID=79078 RepID=A0ABU6QX85_9FABA|nr:hypothetical protein [Stylosanthes scabra]